MRTSSPANISATTLEDYAHSPFHYAVVLGDHTGLVKLVSSLPKLTEPDQIHTESDSLSQERVAEKISAVIDRRDVPFRETPLHLAVRIGDVFAAKTISFAGADITLQNAAGWNPLHEALCRRNSDMIETILHHHRRSAWCKWRRRLPNLIAVLRRMRDFYMEISFTFESSVIPFVGKIAPSDTYKIWKRGGDLRADTSLAGFDGFKIRRANQSFMFLSDGDEFLDVSPGTLLVLNRDDKTIANAFENASDPISGEEIAGFRSQSSLYRPGMDVTKAELVEMKNWRRQDKIETVGKYKAKGYDVENVIFSFKSRKIAGETEQLDDSEESQQSFSEPLRRQRRQQSCLFDEGKEEAVSLRRRRKERSVSLPEAAVTVGSFAARIKEKEYVKSLSPSVWLTEDFPLKTEELLPLLDILANNVKAVRRMRELLTAKLPAGAFPVKLSIPVIPTVKVVITFSKFVALRPMDQFYTPHSSPRHLSCVVKEDQSDVDIDQKSDISTLSTSRPSFSKLSWLKLNRTVTGKSSKLRMETEEEEEQMVDPFVIPTGYKWTSNSDKSGKKTTLMCGCAKVVMRRK
ncbi:unnamed protein product [Cochlearia groenlandica]